MKRNLIIYFFTFFFVFNVNSAFAKTYIITHVIKGRLDDTALAILEKAYNKIGEDVSFKLLPGERAISDSNDGVTDGEAHRVNNIQKKYPNLLKIPTSYITAENVVFSKSLSIHITGYESLKPYRIGFNIGLKIAEESTKGFPYLNLVTKEEQAFLMLNSNRVDLVIAERFSGLRHLKILGLKEIKILDDPVNKVQLFHYVHKKNRSIVPKLDSAFQTMLKDGTIEKILKEMEN